MNPPQTGRFTQSKVQTPINEAALLEKKGLWAMSVYKFWAGLRRRRRSRVQGCHFAAGCDLSSGLFCALFDPHQLLLTQLHAYNFISLPS
jgi:hypothetical protein